MGKKVYLPSFGFHLLTYTKNLNNDKKNFDSYYYYFVREGNFWTDGNKRKGSEDK